MYPILYEFGSIIISSLWTFVTLGFFASLLILHRLLQKDRKKISFIAQHILAILLSGIVIARIVFLLRNLDFFRSAQNENGFWGIFFIWDKGLSPWGAILGIILALLYFTRKEKENLWEWLDIATMSIFTSFIFANIGTFLDGQGYGRETNLPWGVIIENSRYSVPIHPVQLYAAIFCALLTFALYHFYRNGWQKKNGNTALFGIGMYALFRFLNEFLRGDESNYFLGLREAQIYCIISLVAVSILWYIKNKPSHHHPSSP